MHVYLRWKPEHYGHTFPHALLFCHQHQTNPRPASVCMCASMMYCLVLVSEFQINGTPLDLVFWNLLFFPSFLSDTHQWQLFCSTVNFI